MFGVARSFWETASGGAVVTGSVAILLAGVGLIANAMRDRGVRREAERIWMRDQLVSKGAIFLAVARQILEEGNNLVVRQLALRQANPHWSDEDFRRRLMEDAEYSEVRKRLWDAFTKFTQVFEELSIIPNSPSREIETVRATGSQYWGKVYEELPKLDHELTELQAKLKSDKDALSLSIKKVLARFD